MTRETLQNIFRNPYSLEVWQNLLINLFGASEIRKTPAEIESDKHDKVSGYLLGELNTSDHYRIGLFAFEVGANTKIEMNRVGLRSLVRSYTKYQYDAAISVYYNDKQWRLSFISDLKGENTAPKRFTYVFGNEVENYRTAAGQLIKLYNTKPTFESIKDAFSVEKLSRDFFAEYKKQYDKFVGSIGDNKSNRDYVKKMMGRLVFLQFLQKKGWMNGDLNYLQNLYNNSEYKDDFLEKVLEPLFFEVLNTKECNREAKKLENLGTKVEIPYLNGGLFERDSNDQRVIVFDASYFENLFEFFSHYNFTIDENDPYDAEVGIDPEMLGHIFENLLEDNKDKGAFYTPKEIVQYMCRQSLIEYLQSKLGKQSEIEAFVNRHDVSSKFIITNAREIERHLDEVKICDPAIGSGAFPMGILNEIFHCKMALDLTLDRAETKKAIIQNSIYGVDIEQGAVDIARLRFWLSLVVDEDVPQPLPNLDYKIMCGNSLLSRHALDTPIKEVFAEYNKGKKKEDQFTLESYKALVSGYTNNSNKEEKAAFRTKIEEIKRAFKTELDKNVIKKRIKLQSEINNLKADNLFGTASKEELKLAKEKEKKLKIMLDNEANVTNNKLYADAFEWRFELPALLDDDGVFMGFDIVIGNPPYLRIQGIRDVDSAMADEYLSKYDSATGAFDLYALFVERGLKIAHQTDGIVNYIMPVKWTNAAFGKGLRKTIASRKAANRIITFGAYQVFNASTYTGLQWFKPNSETMQYCELDRNLYTNEELGSYLSDLVIDSYANIPAEKLTEKTWVLTVGETTKILNRLEQQPRRVSNIFDKIFQGLATSKDDVYFLYDCFDYGDTIKGISKYLGEVVEIEKGLVKPLLKGDGVHRYDNISTDKVVIFPYKLEGGKANLYAESEISESFPMGYAYLKRCEDVLRGREKGRFNIDGEWFQFGRKQGILSAENEKLVAPDISMGGNFAYDANGEFYSTTTIYGYVKKSEVSDNYKVLMAILNSRLCWWFLTNTGTTLANGFFRFKPDYINPFPVPSYESIAKVEKMIEVLVDYMVYLYDDANSDIIGHTPNKRIRSHIDDILNMVVYELYFGGHMKEVGIDVIADLQKYSFSEVVDAQSIKDFYLWYQTSENLIRQKMMILDTRSRNLIYEINQSKVYEQDKSTDHIEL
ncbi:MAG: TaqI-like C-terminal specificity domain-containing protein [Rikenellaceae bacterium]